MICLSTSKSLIQNCQDFKHIKLYRFFNKFMQGEKLFYGWGRKKSGQMAVKLAKKHNTSFVLLEDGFIRSLGLGVEGSPSFSIVEDDLGIYYDATTPSKLENFFNYYDFQNDIKLMEKTQEAIKLIQKYNISKYNSAPNIKDDFFQDDKKKKVLIIAQTAGDASLEYGLGNSYSTDEMIDTAIEENPKASIYIKIHPDVLSGKKKSDIDVSKLENRCHIISENVNPISLLKHFDKVYTKTSQMGFEALLVGCECVCFGVPFYAGWGVTQDKQRCERRKRVLSVEEIFAGAYILYSRYYNPYKKRDSDIIDTINEIVEQKRLQNV